MVYPMAGERCGIIVVDDDDGVSRAIERTLKTSGWLARSFSSAEQFLAWEDFRTAEFLILDIQLPGMSGLDLRDHLRGIGICPPVIFITGHDRPDFRERAMEKDAVAYLTKPFPAQELIDALRSRLDPA
jgi:FixJ family two-component response regulator